MIFKYCPQCGIKLDKKEIGDEGLVPFCAPCNRGWFSFSYPCVICLVADENNNIILTKATADSEYCGLVAGFVKAGETIEDTAKREIEEEVGLEAIEINFMKSYYFEKDDRLMFGFVCKAKHSHLNISKELYSAKWHSASEAPNFMRQGSISLQLVTDYLQSIKS
jgi:NAD+ diphosphatase